MKTILAAGTIAAVAAIAATPPVISAPAETPPAAGSVFADLAALGYDLGKFRPGHQGRYPYR